MTESVAEFCSTVSPRKKYLTDDEILKHLEAKNPGMKSDRFFVNWLDEIPDAGDSEKLIASLNKRITAIDADMKLKSAQKAAEAAADAAKAAKSAKAAKRLFKAIF